MTMHEGPQARPTRSPSLTAFLSFLWPGLGHAYLRNWRVAAAFGIPPLFAIAYLAWQARKGIEYLAASLIIPSFAFTLVLLAVVFVVWRLAALGHSWLTSGTPAARRQPAARAVLIVLAILTVGSQALIGYYAWAFYDASSQIFGTDGGTAAASPSPGSSLDASPSPSDGSAADNFAGVTPDVSAAPQSDRISILVTGIDAYRTRSEALNDTILVISVDPTKQTAVMLSVPRDTSDFPMYDGGTYGGKINSLMTAAYLHPRQYPDGPVTTLTREVGFLLGIPIQYYAAIDLAGFSRMVDLVGGIDVNNPKPINDPAYDWLDGTHGFTLSAGPHHLNGRLALAYVRSRQGVGDNDYTRSARQQQVLVALKAKMTQPAMVAKLPQLLAAAAKTVKTDFPPTLVGDMLSLSKDIPAASIQHFVLGPPYNYHPPSNTTGGVWTSRLYMDKVSALSIKLFGTDSSYWTNNPYGPTGASLATPTPSPTASPSTP